MSNDNGEHDNARNQSEETSRKTCFVIAPIGASGTETRRATDGLVDTVINPVLVEFDYEVEIAHRISETGSINKQVITRLVDSDLVVAVLTDLNPNVMYELGVRHASRKPVISLALEGTALPFDVGQERTVFYENDMHGVKDARAMLRDHVDNIDDENIDNPIYRAIEFDLMERNLRESGDNAMADILDMLQRILNETQRSSRKIPDARDDFTISAEEHQLRVSNLIKNALLEQYVV